MSQNKEIIGVRTIETLTNKLNIAKNNVFGASKPTEMKEALNTLVGIKESIRLAKAKLKEIEANPKAQIKQLETMFKELEEEIKTKTMETYEEKIVQKMNPETGEVKNKLENNLGSKLFTYTPEKSNYVIDKSLLITIGTDEEYLANDFPQLENIIDKLVIPKTTYVIDEEALANYIEANGTKDLPMKEVKTKSKLGIQYAQILAGLRDKPKEVE